MKIGIIGASGKSGISLTKEALLQGFQVVALVLDVNSMPQLNINNRLEIKKTDALSKVALLKVLDGIDILINAYGPTNAEAARHDEIAKVLIDIMKEKPSLQRLIVVGGTSSLTRNGGRIFDEPAFPSEWKEDAGAQIRALDLYRQSEVKWTYFSPAYNYDPDGPRTNKFKIGTNNLLIDHNGHSNLSYADAACAIINEIKNHQFIKKRFTAAY